MTDSLGHSDLQIDLFIFNLLRSVALLLLLDTAVLLCAAHTLAVVDDVVWVPVILDFEQPRVDVSKIPKEWRTNLNSVGPVIAVFILRKKWAGHPSKIRNFLRGKCADRQMPLIFSMTEVSGVVHDRAAQLSYFN